MRTEDIVGIVIAGVFGVPIMGFLWLMMIVVYRDILAEIRKDKK